MDQGDLLNQGLILLEANPGSLATAIPVVESAGRDLEVVTKHGDGMIEPHRVNPFESFGEGSERIPNVFFKMSRCSRR